MAVRVLVVLALLSATALAPRSADAQRVCDEASVGALAASLRPRDLGLPRSRERSRPCMQVSVLPTELGTPVVARPAGARCALAAVAYRRTVTRSETCGYDVHFEPLVETGVAVFAPAGRRLRRVARGELPMASLDLLRALPSTEEEEGPRSTPFALGERRLVVVRRRVELAPAAGG